MLRSALRGTGMAMASAAIGGTYLYQTDEGSKRSMTFWYNIAPVQYRFVQFLEKDTGFISNENANQKYDALHDRHTSFIQDLVYRMRGFYLKQAQLMSTQDDFVPLQYMKWCKDTQDNVPSEFNGSGAREYTAQKMQEEQGLNFDDVFESWDDTPLGVASIGEVHKAVLKGSNEVVAVKILVPGIEHRFRADIRTLKSFCRLAMPQHVTAMDEIEKQFLTEFDYTAEAKSLEVVRTNVMVCYSSFFPFSVVCNPKHLKTSCPSSNI